MTEYFSVSLTLILIYFLEIDDFILYLNSPQLTKLLLLFDHQLFHIKKNYS